MNETNTFSQQQIAYFLHLQEKKGFGILGKINAIPNPGQLAREGKPPGSANMN